MNKLIALFFLCGAAAPFVHAAEKMDTMRKPSAEESDLKVSSTEPFNVPHSMRFHKIADTKTGIVCYVSVNTAGTGSISAPACFKQ
jgi:hypothetical protein